MMIGGGGTHEQVMSRGRIGPEQGESLSPAMSDGRLSRSSRLGAYLKARPSPAVEVLVLHLSPRPEIYPTTTCSSSPLLPCSSPAWPWPPPLTTTPTMASRTSQFPPPSLSFWPLPSLLHSGLKLPTLPTSSPRSSKVSPPTLGLRGTALCPTA